MKTCFLLVGVCGCFGVLAAPCARIHNLKPGHACTVALQGHTGYLWHYTVDKPGHVAIKYLPHHALKQKKARRVTKRMFSIKGLRPGAVTITFTEQAKDPAKKAHASKPHVVHITIEHAVQPHAAKSAHHKDAPHKQHGVVQE